MDMRIFLCVAIMAFMVGCADYAENALYGDEYIEEVMVENIDSADSEVATGEDLADEVATNETADSESVASMVSNLETNKPNEVMTTDENEEVEEEVKDGEIIISQESPQEESTEPNQATTDSEVAEVVANTNKETPKGESSEVAIADDKVTNAESAPQVPQIAQSASVPQAQAKAGITKIDDNTFEYNGVIFKHNLGNDADLDAILAELNKKKLQTPQAESIDITAQDSSQASSPKITKKISGKGLKGLAQSITKLKAQCEDKGNLQKCEDLGRIYAARGNVSSSIEYYERACNDGSGSALSCFFLLKIYENDGNSELTQHYANLIDENALRSTKIGKTELLLSTGKANALKRILKMSCTKGNESSCSTLQSVFKVRGELHEMKTYFGTECWKGSELGCTILRSM